ncbi:ABC transporter permease [Vallitalea pronyensis]|uniref:ABC transporter permease n=1 Tax=Vallitalea pronyensis TaxID=1348613 RepID=A0A8J8MLR5_9FIRM|nr:ABC transporter permease [Vallitalea pronyensis]QUI23588.1 ABC transporter permease [Vallitalea pronyensis]
MYNLLKSDFYKLKSMKAFYILLLFPVIQAVGFSYFVPHATGNQTLNNSLSSQEFMVLFLLMGVFASIIITNDFHTGGIRSLISFGHNRMKIIYSKSVVYYFSIILLSLLFPIISTIINTSKNGFGLIVEGDLITAFFVRLLLLMLIYIAESSIFLVIAFITRNSNMVITTAGVIVVMNLILNMYVRKKQSLIGDIYKTTPYYQTTHLLNDPMTLEVIGSILLICVLTIMLCIIVTGFAFNRMDVK